MADSDGERGEPDMADDIKRVQVRIGSVTYSLVSAADEQYTRKIGARADEMIRRVMQSNPQLSHNMAAVLALVNAVDDLSRIYDKMNHNDTRQQANDKKVSEMHLELQRLREQNWEMKKNMLELRALCREYESELAQRRSDQGNRFKLDPEQAGDPADDNTVSPEAVEAAADAAETGPIILAQTEQPEQHPPQQAAEEISKRPLIQTHFDDLLKPHQSADNGEDPASTPQHDESSPEENDKSDG